MSINNWYISIGHLWWIFINIYSNTLTTINIFSHSINISTFHMIIPFVIITITITILAAICIILYYHQYVVLLLLVFYIMATFTSMNEATNHYQWIMISPFSAPPWRCPRPRPPAQASSPGPAKRGAAAWCCAAGRRAGRAPRDSSAACDTPCWCPGLGDGHGSWLVTIGKTIGKPIGKWWFFMGFNMGLKMGYTL